MGVQVRRRGHRRFLSVAIAAGSTLLATALLADTSVKAAEPSLREQAEKAGVLIGSGSINPAYLDEPKFAETLAREFESLSPENEMKWDWIQPNRGDFRFEPIDKLVAFARKNDMVVKGHGLITSLEPAWLQAIADPDELRAVAFEHFNTIMDRYPKIVDRWDVITEPLSTFGGTGLTQNHWYQKLGPDYISELFRIADRADKKAKLFLNEALVESYPAKRQELYALVKAMVDDGVPIDGVGLEMHETLVGPAPGVITEIVKEYQALGLEVAFTELEAHTYDNVTQAQIYSDVFTEALAAGVTDISFWGFTDKYIWTWQPGAKPHIFDKDYNPKPAYFAILEVLAGNACLVTDAPDCWASMTADDATVSVQDPIEPPEPGDIRPPDNI
jgi:endo-1,4-beta-xylanase